MSNDALTGKIKRIYGIKFLTTIDRVIIAAFLKKWLIQSSEIDLEANSSLWVREKACMVYIKHYRMYREVEAERRPYDVISYFIEHVVKSGRFNRRKMYVRLKQIHKGIRPYSFVDRMLHRPI